MRYGASCTIRVRVYSLRFSYRCTDTPSIGWSSAVSIRPTGPAPITCTWPLNGREPRVTESDIGDMHPPCSRRRAVPRRGRCERRSPASATDHQRTPALGADRATSVTGVGAALAQPVPTRRAAPHPLDLRRLGRDDGARPSRAPRRPRRSPVSRPSRWRPRGARSSARGTAAARSPPSAASSSSSSSSLSMPLILRGRHAVGISSRGMPHSSSQASSCSISGPAPPGSPPRARRPRGRRRPSRARCSLISIACSWCGIIICANITSAALPAAAAPRSRPSRGRRGHLPPPSPPFAAHPASASSPAMPSATAGRV